VIEMLARHRLIVGALCTLGFLVLLVPTLNAQTVPAAGSSKLTFTVTAHGRIHNRIIIRPSELSQDDVGKWKNATYVVTDKRSGARMLPAGRLNSIQVVPASEPMKPTVKVELDADLKRENQYEVTITLEGSATPLKPVTFTTPSAWGDEWVFSFQPNFTSPITFDAQVRSPDVLQELKSGYSTKRFEANAHYNGESTAGGTEDSTRNSVTAKFEWAFAGFRTDELGMPVRMFPLLFTLSGEADESFENINANAGLEWHPTPNLSDDVLGGQVEASLGAEYCYQAKGDGDDHPGRVTAGLGWGRGLGAGWDIAVDGKGWYLFGDGTDTHGHVEATLSHAAPETFGKGASLELSYVGGSEPPDFTPYHEFVVGVRFGGTLYKLK
jgi:hypothetical protein